ncbi:MAG: glutamate--tRNA ligase [Saprospiraceae bacterium]|uniref:Glutamate--tRNA ligase n=1 Tax=Candidatus Opimibacter skivensis TaxID=2982028 RepID=A0A9D7SV85_9BACT|nr:glutamate--tRNA ligase [Candidatus Opimibacter skivensis]
MTRLRFAPSPTGALHIGGIRTALYNYLLARKTGGQFILRIEDTDQTRYVPGAEDYIIRSLAWLGLNPDEGPIQGGPFAPYRQSERTAIYHDHAMQLVKSGKAYIAFDTPEELDLMRQRLTDKGISTPKYDASVRDEMVNSLTLSEDEVNRKIADKVPYTVRLLVEPGHGIIIHDKIRGEVIFDSTELDDKILLKADGFPTYHLANVVDDHLMQITDVIRGEEWLPSTAHHVLLYRAFGWIDTMPTFSHLPLILKPNGQGKLSKRDGQKFGFPVFPMAWHSDHIEESIEGFDSYGFEPAAVINFLAFLGWNPGTEQEIFSLEQLIDVFDAERIHKGGARFDYDKALWFNSQYLQHLDYAIVQERLIQYANNENISISDVNVEAVFKLLQPRLHRLKEFFMIGYYFFTDELKYDDTEINKKWNPEAGALLQKLGEALGNIEPFTAENISIVAKELITASGIKMGVIMPLIRASLTGTIQGPDVYEIASLLGSVKTIERFVKMAGWTSVG